VHDLPLAAQSVAQMVDATLALPEGTRLLVLAPVVRDRKGEFADLFEAMQSQGYVRFRVDGKTVEATDLPALKKTEKHDIDVVVDRIKVQPGLESRPRRELRGGTAGRGRPGHRPRDGLGARAPVLEQVRLSDLQLLAVRARAAPLLLQLAGRRVPDL
jgi:excinuclease ABC subunit A